MSQDWGWAAVIIAIPFVIFGAFEMMGAIQRKRSEAVARRPKGARRDASGSRRGRAG